jgi:hypothetical protein
MCYLGKVLKVGTSLVYGWYGKYVVCVGMF